MRGGEGEAKRRARLTIRNIRKVRRVAVTLMRAGGGDEMGPYAETVQGSDSWPGVVVVG